MSELSRSTRALLDRGRAPEPLSPAHRARLKKSVMAKVGVASALAAATWWSPAAAKIVTSAVVLVGLGGAGAAWKLGAFDARAPEPAAAAVHASSAVTVAAAAQVAEAPPAAVVAPGPSLPVPEAIVTMRATTASAPRAARRRADIAVDSPPAATARPATAAYGAPTPTVAPATRGAPEAVSTAGIGTRAAGDDGPSPPAAAPGAPAATLPGSPVNVPALAASPSASTPSPVAQLEEEARLVRQADQALKGGDPARALALLDEHAARFPSGVLSPERSAGRVFALCQAGRLDEAQKEAASFLKTHARGPLSARVEASCAGSRPSGASHESNATAVDRASGP